MARIADMIRMKRDLKLADKASAALDRVVV